MVPWVAPIDIQVRFLIKAWQRKWFDSIIVLLERMGSIPSSTQSIYYLIYYNKITSNHSLVNIVLYLYMKP
jgi:hypothetical protein